MFYKTIKMLLKAIIILISTTIIFAELHHGPAHPIKQILKSQLNSSVEEAFKVWHFLHKRNYKINSEEGKLRFENFKKNFDIIKKHNSKIANSYSLGLNNFADLTVGEFHKKYLFNNKVFFHQNLRSTNDNIFKNTKYKTEDETMQINSEKDLFNIFWNIPDVEDESFQNPTNNEIITSEKSNLKNLRFLDSSINNNESDNKNKKTNYNTVNWILDGALNQFVEQQGECGSCWAFSAAQALQAAYSLKTGISEKFSKQQLVDCEIKSDACNGGFPHYAMDYIKNTGLLKEEDYPYKTDMTEKYKKNCILNEFDFAKKNSTVKIKDFEYCIDNDDCKNDQGLFDMLSRGPLSAVVDASEEFMLYENGVFDKPCSEMNHAILVAGYHKADKDGDSSYWIVKNSWGLLWGDHGYIKIKHAKDYNSCLLNQYYLRPIL